MKPIITLFFALFASLGLTRDAFAIDQVILSNGTIVEGKVLSDVPNRHVDIEMINGTKKRFQKTEVASIERDVPSNKDSNLLGNTSRMYAGGLFGLALVNDDSLKTAFNFGARFGVNFSQMGDFAKLAAGISIDHYKITDYRTTNTNLLAQLLLRKINNGGLYFGPEFGLSFAKTEIEVGAVTLSSSKTTFAAGAVIGYDYYATPTVSFGPEIHFQHRFDSALSGNDNFRFLISGTVHFE